MWQRPFLMLYLPRKKQVSHDSFSSMNYLSVIVPGPWWTPLTYACGKLPVPSPLPGSRIKVPLGKTSRVGFFLSRESPPPRGEGRKFTIREAGEFLETFPPMGKELWELALWISRRYLCAPGLALKTVLPEQILRGEILLSSSQEPEKREGHSSYSCIYKGQDSLRYQVYADMLQQAPSARGIFVFPEIEQARSFWLYLQKRELLQGGALWDLSGKGKKEKQFFLWEQIRQGTISFLVGSLGSIYAPFPKMDFIVIDQEESGAYESRKTPFLHARSILAKRGSYFSSSVCFGGRVPSSRVFVQLKPKFQESFKGSFVFTHPSRGVPLVAEGAEGELPLSRKLLEESLERQKRGEGVLWIFDRTDHHRELLCADCGHVFTCSFCGGLLEMGESGRYLCSRCGASEVSQEHCPHCRGAIFAYRRAGLQGLHKGLQSLLGQSALSFLFDREKKHGGLPLEKIRKSGGIILGTRKALSLCDILPVSLVAWLDADAEARRSTYNSREKAFRMVWESCWRGREHFPSRKIFLQTRNPRKGWQGALEKGWESFWRDELRERKIFSFPPYGILIEFSAHPLIRISLEEELERQGVSFSHFPGTPERSEEVLWIKCEKTTVIFEAIRRVFDIQNPHTKIRKPCTLRIWRD